MRPLNVQPLRIVAAAVELEDGTRLETLSCAHELLNAQGTLEELRDCPARRCPYCIAGIERVLPIERVPA